MASFFEKLTGASADEEIEEIELITPKTKPAKSEAGISKPKKEKTRSKSASSEKTIKENIITMPKKQTIKKSPVEGKIVEKEDWLDEAEAEEGQLTIDVYQTEANIVIKSTIAGVNPEDIDVSITNDMVTIRGKRVKDEKIETENYYYQELYWGGFSRSVILPVEVDADKAKAGIKNGILTIKLPKAEKVKTKKISVITME